MGLFDKVRKGIEEGINNRGGLETIAGDAVSTLRSAATDVSQRIGEIQNSEDFNNLKTKVETAAASAGQQVRAGTDSIQQRVEEKGGVSTILGNTAANLVQKGLDVSVEARQAYSGKMEEYYQNRETPDLAGSPKGQKLKGPENNR